MVASWYPRRTNRPTGRPAVISSMACSKDERLRAGGLARQVLQVWTQMEWPQQVEEAHNEPAAQSWSVVHVVAPQATTSPNQRALQLTLMKTISEKLTSTDAAEGCLCSWSCEADGVGATSPTRAGLHPVSTYKACRAVAARRLRGYNGGGTRDGRSARRDGLRHGIHFGVGRLRHLHGGGRHRDCGRHWSVQDRGGSKYRRSDTRGRCKRCRQGCAGRYRGGLDDRSRSGRLNKDEPTFSARPG